MDFLLSGLDFFFLGDRSIILVLKCCLISFGEDLCDVGVVIWIFEMLFDFFFFGVFMNFFEFVFKGVFFCGGCVFLDKLGFLVRGMIFCFLWVFGKGMDENLI